LDENPNTSVIGTAPIAAAAVKGYSGPSMGIMMTKIGIKRAAAPISLSIAVVATQMERGNINQ